MHHIVHIKIDTRLFEAAWYELLDLAERDGAWLPADIVDEFEMLEMLMNQREHDSSDYVRVEHCGDEGWKILPGPRLIEMLVRMREIRGDEFV